MKDDYYEQEQYSDPKVPEEHKLTDAERRKIKIKGIIGIILIVVGFGLFISDIFIPFTFDTAGFAMTYGAISGLGGMALIAIGFFLAIPLINKKSAQISRNAQLYSKEELSEVSDINAEIKQKGVKRTAKAFKEGINDADEETDAKKFCSQCGQKISKSARFCSHCGSEQK